MYRIHVVYMFPYYMSCRVCRVCISLFLPLSTQGRCGETQSAPAPGPPGQLAGRLASPL